MYGSIHIVVTTSPILKGLMIQQESFNRSSSLISSSHSEFLYRALQSLISFRGNINTMNTNYYYNEHTLLTQLTHT